MKTMITLSLAALLRVRAFQPTAVPRFASVALFSSTSADTNAKVSHPSFPTEVVERYNKQVTNELTASQLYLSASLWCDMNELPGMAKYFKEESAEEREHALGFIDFANKRRLPVTLQPLDAPKKDWKDVTDLWESLLEYEQFNTKEIKSLADLADETNDRSMTALLDPFHMEQVEEEDKMMKMVAKVRDISQTPGLLRQLDSEMEGEADADE